MNPKISFIIPAYNATTTIKRCVDSIIKMETDIEILIIDDGSNDNLKDYIKNYYENDCRILYLKKENGGVSSARNYGIKKSKGEYISFVDADDEIISNTYEDMLKLMQRYKSDWVQGEYIKLKKNKECRVILSHKISTLVSYPLVEVLKKYNFGYVWGKIYKRSLMEKDNLQFDEAMTYAEDRLFNMKYALLINSALYINSVSNKYYLSKKSLSRRYCSTYYDNMLKIQQTSIDLSNKYKLKFLENVKFEIVIGSIRNEFRKPNIKKKECLDFLRLFLRSNLDINRLTVGRYQDIILKKVLMTKNEMIIYFCIKILNIIKG